ncbi:MAG: 50S ribosomal protein L40e [Candidatus Aenigmarchaeota archaeon]|nr:50S ribosomal protein L40e [Candidatus Aenigmarchaeota archaeon]
MVKKLNEIVLKRNYLNVYVCMNCNAKLRTTQAKVALRKSKCRKCGSKDLRLKAKERRGAKV